MIFFVSCSAAMIDARNPRERSLVAALATRNSACSQIFAELIKPHNCKTYLHTFGASKGDGDDRLALLLPFAGKRSSSWPIKLPLFNDFFSPFPSLVAFTFARPSERAQNSDEINCMNVVKKQHNTEIIHSRQIENDDVARTYSLLRRHV